MGKEGTKPTKGFRLFKEIIDRSRADSWEEAKLEWDLDRVQEASDEDVVLGTYKCLCGHGPLKELCYIINRNTIVEVLVGNCCITKFMGQIESNKIFQAIKNRKINRFTLDHVNKKGKIRTYEYNFAKTHIRKRKLTPSRRIVFDQINVKVLNAVKDCKKKMMPHEVEMLKQMDTDAKEDAKHDI